MSGRVGEGEYWLRTDLSYDEWEDVLEECTKELGLLNTKTEQVVQKSLESKSLQKTQPRSPPPPRTPKPPSPPIPTTTTVTPTPSKTKEEGLFALFLSVLSALAMILSHFKLYSHTPNLFP